LGGGIKPIEPLLETCAAKKGRTELAEIIKFKEYFLKRANHAELPGIKLTGG